MVRRTKLYNLVIHRFKFICKKIKIAAKKRLHKKLSFMVTFTEEIFNEKLNFCAVKSC